ncbi:hypothetical protein Hanom_Chr15g01382831 [Helianthus anomalus]
MLTDAKMLKKRLLNLRKMDALRFSLFIPDLQSKRRCFLNAKLYNAYNREKTQNQMTKG